MTVSLNDRRDLFAGDGTTTTFAVTFPRDLDSDVDVRLTPGTLGILPKRVTIGDTVDWLEPYIGARLMFQLSEAWNLGVRGTIGGFGIGSELTWDFLVGAGYQVKDNFALYFGYRAMDIDYEGSIDIDLQIRGPMIGGMIEF